MRLVFTKSTTILSRAIRLVTGQDCSHFAIVFDSASKGLMFESNLLGTHPAFYVNSLKTHKVIHEIKVPLSIKDEDYIYDRTVEEFDGKPYAYLAMLYLGYRYALKRLFNIALPKRNPFVKKDQFFCDQIYEILSGIKGFPKVDVANGLETPHDLWIKLKDWKPNALRPRKR